MARIDISRNPRVLRDDVRALSALKRNVGKTSASPLLGVAKLEEAKQAMDAARKAEARARAVWRAAHDEAVVKETTFHNLVSGACWLALADMDDPINGKSRRRLHVV